MFYTIQGEISVLASLQVERAQEREKLHKMSQSTKEKKRFLISFVLKESRTTLICHCSWLSFLGGRLSSLIYICLGWKQL